MVGQPLIELERLDVWNCGVGVGATKEKQSFDDLAKLHAQPAYYSKGTYEWQSLKERNRKSTASMMSTS